MALCLQGIAVACVWFCSYIFAIKLSLTVFVFVAGLVAAGFSLLVKLDRWWLPIQALFVPAMAFVFVQHIHPNVFLAAFLILLLVFWNTFRTQVPLYLSSVKVWEALETFLPQPSTTTTFSFVDIGSGLGGVLTHLAKTRPDGRYFGIESAPLPFLWSWLRIHLGHYRQCQVHWGNLWDYDLSQYDIVFAYLSPAPMERLWQKAKAEMQPGTVFISSTFAVPGQLPVQSIRIADLHQSTLLVWRM